MGWTKHFDEQHAPDDGEATDFDWSGLLARMGEGGDMEEADFARLGAALRSVFEWLIDGEDVIGKRFGQKATRKLVAMLWVIDPAYFGASPSLSQLARKMGVDKVVLSRPSAKVSRKFGVRNRFQTAHDWKRAKPPTKKEKRK